jgi:quercetin dioxygenase-like cupin family protein
MKKRAFLGWSLLLLACSLVQGQDAMKFGVKHLTILAEDDKVRVLRFAPSRGDRTPMHSHPASVAYVVKGGRIRTTSPDGKSTETMLTPGETVIRPAVTHSDEALDDLEVILVELKR